MKNLKKIFLAATMLVMLQSSVFAAEVVCLPDLEITKNWTLKETENCRFKSQIDFNDEAYCEPLNWEDKDCDHEGYCESIYWEDELNCVDWEDDLEEISQERCESLYGATQKKCFELLLTGKK